VTNEPEVCWTIGCENETVEDGYCAECTDISPGILDSDDSGESSEDGHRASDVSSDHDNPESEATESPDSAPHSPVEGGSSNANPGFESDGSTAHAQAAFADAVDWFHSQLHHDITDLDLTYVDDNGDEQTVETPREWFHEVRGWSDATIDDKRLGWASPHRTGLLDHLMREGYDRDAILATGLFTESLDPLWQGRFVFPYFDADGQPIYAISRATGDEGGGAVGYDGHPDDGLSGKYAKPAHTKPYAHVEEPIFGLGSVEDGQPVLITEGIADAITAQQAGYACISPVTTRFKREDREALREVLEDHDVPRAYVVQDAERPSSDVDEDDRLSLTQVGEGLRGALDTAAYLAEHETDARVAELPRPGLDKVDLDDYLREWSSDGSLAPLLASAKPAREHPAYDPQDAAIDAADRNRPDPLGNGSDDSDASHSALFDLDIQDASGLDADYRGASPLGHHGESEKYFVVIEKRDVAYDHKYKAAYTPLTYLLADAGERSPDDPNGRLSDEEIFVAWRHAKRERIIPTDDPIPRRALRHIAVDHGHCERDEIEDGWKLPRDAYDDALDTLTDEYDCEPGRDPISTGWNTPDAVDPTTLDVVLDPELAWKAARQVDPDDLDTALDLAPTSDGECWQCPGCGEAVDVVRAVAIQQGIIARCEEPLADAYDEAYRRAREQFGAPLPEYVTTATATDNWAVVQGAVSQLTYYHLSDIESEVTGDGDDDKVMAVLDPTWADSASGERIVAFRSGGFYCREHERMLDPLRFVALEQGIIDECDDALAGEAFTEAYHVAREQYGAPLPEWNTGNPDHVPVLPRADDLLGEFTTDRDALDDAREHVENLYAQLATDTRKAWLLRSLPATGKTTSVVKNADEYPALYLTSRNELQQEVAAKADQWDLTSMHLPIFAEDQPNEAAIGEGTAHIHEESKDLLRCPEELAERIDAPITDDEDDESGDSNDEDPDDTDLDRGSCPVANGDHGKALHLAVHVARNLGHSPQEIHTRDTELFGQELPCHDDCECDYKLAWDRATDPENPNDILIGHYGHGFVTGARTYAERDDDRTHVTERVIAIDEFPGDVYDEEFGEEFADHAAWLGRALHPDVEDRQDLFEQDLWDDEFMQAWLRGNATTEIATVADTDQRLAAMERLSTALTAVEELQETLDDEETPLADALRQAEALGPAFDASAIAGAHDALREAVEDADRQVSKRINNDVLPAFVAAERALADDGDGESESPGLGTTSVPDPLGGDLAQMVEDAIEAFHQQRDGVVGLLSAAQTALDGGEDGCRELAVRAKDGYAHPLAHLLLHGVIAPEDDDSVPATEITTEAFDFEADSDGGTDGTNLKSVQRDRETILVDRNHHGATVRHPPAFRSGDHPNPVVGLDATGREHLWKLAIGCEVETRDIHDSARERRAFLRDVLNLQVVQTSPHINSYSGSPNSKNFDGDVALTAAIYNEYAATQLRRDTLTATSKPGVITTKKVRTEIEERIEAETAAIDHYGNITGSNALGDLNLGIVLGCRHFGDAVVEKWAALAGETVEHTGKGVDLDYGSETANTFLQHMREDQTLQAILRFGRDKEGAVVFAHTAALAESLPVVGDGAVVKAFSEGTKEVARAAKTYRGQEFGVGDIDDDVECSRRTVQRALSDLADLGYLAKTETKAGLANEFSSVEGTEPGVGEAELPTLDEPFASDKEGVSDPAETTSRVSSTGFVWVSGSVTDDLDSGGSQRNVRGTLPAPENADSATLPG
jgi:hypothetical protein